jgi:uncharacterized membrane protein
MTEIVAISDEDKARDIKEHKDLAAFSYVWIMSVFIFFLRHSPFVTHHAKQGIVLFLLSLPLLFIPLIGHLLTLPLIAAMMYGFIQASHGEASDIPLIGKLSRGELAWAQMRDELKKMLNAMREEWGKFRMKDDKKEPEETKEKEESKESKESNEAKETEEKSE